MHELTSYQSEIARAVVDSVLHDRGLTFTVEITRGGGVRELSAQLELLLLTMHVNDSARLLRVAPPGAESTREYIVRSLHEHPLRGLWSAQGPTVRLGRSTLRFVSPDDFGPVLASPAGGSTGLIEVADAQMVSEQTYDRWIAPLADAKGATTVLYGTPLNGETRFEQTKQCNREAEAADGIRRHFRVTPEQAAKAIPGYELHLEQARIRLGEEHPDFQTAYLLRPTAASGPLLAPRYAHALEEGNRQHRRTPGALVLASVVVTRLPELEPTLVPLLRANPGCSAVISIAERNDEDGLRVVEHRWLQAIDPATLAKHAAGILKEWAPTSVSAEITRGAGTEAFRPTFERALGRTPIAWHSADEACAGYRPFALLATVHTGKLSVYRADGSPEYRALRHELGTAIAGYEEGGRLQLRLPSGDEGFLRGLVLLTKMHASAMQRTADTLEKALAS